MTEEQAIEILQEHKKQIDKEYISARNSKAIEIVLSMLKEKDKQIDLMIKELKKQFRRSEPCDLDFEVECKKYKTCEECIKNYFEGKVEEE